MEFLKFSYGMEKSGGNRRFPEIKRAVYIQRAAAGMYRYSSASAPAPPGTTGAPEP